ncbi:unnamed protein product [Mesocestoides corti]|uniref:Transposase n=1 Tax=Mesocestoides corti TaxID=53468 RepID=A0A0R3U6N0_MESCO|nr:unnamed protein product [Mesocestoides corti]
MAGWLTPQVKNLESAKELSPNVAVRHHLLSDKNTDYRNAHQRTRKQTGLLSAVNRTREVRYWRCLPSTFELVRGRKLHVPLNGALTIVCVQTLR